MNSPVELRDAQAWVQQMRTYMSSNQAMLLLGIGGMSLAYLLSGVYMAFRVPKQLSRLPRIPLAVMFRALFTKSNGFVNDHEAWHKASDEWCERNGINYTKPRRQMMMQWLLGRWSLVTWNPTHIRRVLTDLETFPKLLLPPKLMPLTAKLIGVNVASSNGDVWKAHRKISHPAFNRRWNTEIFAETVRVFFGEMDRHLGEGLECNSWMQRLTLDALSVAAFGRSFESLTTPDSDLVHTYNATMTMLFDRRARILPFWQHLPLPSVRQAAVNVNKFNRHINELIDRRTVEVEAERAERATGADADEGKRDRDLLTRMIEANLDDPTFTRDNLRNNVIVFFIAGHDTTSNALSVALYFMGMHKDVQQKARQEVIDLMGDVDPTTPADAFPAPTTDEQAQLTYLTYVIKESLRLYPSVARLGFRSSDKPIELEPGLVLPAKTGVSIDILQLHRDPGIWGDDVLEFKPDRWRDISFLTGGKPGKAAVDPNENSQSLTGGVPMMPAQHNYSWMPFGAGQRICLGQGFSVLEQRVILAMTLLRYEWDVVGDEEALAGKLRTGEGGLLHPTNLQIRFKTRTC
ncbi:hypothetical protein RI367_002407 [Sorochytrium milnesiophthora]